MRQYSETWAALAKTGSFGVDAVAEIGGVEYATISAPIIHSELFSEMAVGRASTASLRLSVLTDDPIPAGAKVVIRARLYDDRQASEWAEFGTFWIDNRKNNNGLTSLVAYDAMLKANAPCVDPSKPDDRISWPKSMIDVVHLIAERIGVDVDSRTEIRIRGGYMVSYPAEYSMLQLLEFIGAINGGNWIITPENRLRLVPLESPINETFNIIDQDGNRIITGAGDALVWKFRSAAPEMFGIVDHRYNQLVTREGDSLVYKQRGDLRDVVRVPVVVGSISTGQQQTVSRVTLEYDEEKSYTRGDDSGVELRSDRNPYAGVWNASEMFRLLQGVQYNPFTVTGACFDPAAELGDCVIVGDQVCSILCSQTITLNNDFRADIAAPMTEEISSEYPHESAINKLERKIDADKKEITTRIEQTLESITLDVSNGETASTIRLNIGGVEMSSSEIKLSGLVTFNGLLHGTTSIDGACIKTGTINADVITLAGRGGGFRNQTGFDGKSETYGAMMHGSDENYYVFASDAGVRMQTPGTSFYCTSDLIVASKPIAETSDARAKRDIDRDASRYEEFFRRLQPSYYRFKSGDARYHVGFIAQDVEQALTAAGLGMDDFAGLVKDERGNYMLSYTEFVPINTHMIQRLLDRIDKLEHRIAELENEQQGGQNGRQEDH